LLLGSYVAGELSAATAEAITEHLKKCHVCAAQCRDYRAARDALLRYGKRSVPEGAWDGLWEVIRDAVTERTAAADEAVATAQARNLRLTVGLVAVIILALAAFALTYFARSKGSANTQQVVVEQRTTAPRYEVLPSAPIRRETPVLIHHYNRRVSGYGITAVRLASSDESDFAY